MGKTQPISEVDIAVGARLRLRRTELALSQQELAAHLQITYQQLQKNEKGINRIGASRLFQMAAVLKVPVDYFFQDLRSDSADPNKKRQRDEELPPVTAGDLR